MYKYNNILSITNLPIAGEDLQVSLKILIKIFKGLNKSFNNSCQDTQRYSCQDLSGSSRVFNFLVRSLRILIFLARIFEGLQGPRFKDFVPGSSLPRSFTKIFEDLGESLQISLQDLSLKDLCKIF